MAGWFGIRARGVGVVGWKALGARWRWVGMPGLDLAPLGPAWDYRAEQALVGRAPEESQGQPANNAADQSGTKRAVSKS